MFPNITPDTYTVEVTMDGFRTVRRPGVRVSGGDRVTVPALTIEPGGASRNGQRHGRGAAHPGVERRTLLRRLDGADREPADQPPGGSFTNFTSFTPGVVAGGASAGGTRLGGVGQNNIMMDGISAMDTGNNGQMLNMNIESIAEVKVLTQGYQAEYGRSSGLQITAVTKSGTNRFRGSVYDIKINSDWNANSWVNEKNGDAKPINKRDICGYSIGGPVGRPGGNNKLFFFYSHEYRPTNAAINGGNPIRFRVPTRARARGRLLADARQQRRAHSRHPRLHDGPRCSAPTRRLLSGRRRDRQDSSEPSLSAGPRAAQPLPDAEHRSRRPARTTTTRSTPPAVENLTAAAGHPRSTTSSRSKLRVTGKYSGQRARAR